MSQIKPTLQNKMHLFKIVSTASPFLAATFSRWTLVLGFLCRCNWGWGMAEERHRLQSASCAVRLLGQQRGGEKHSRALSCLTSADVTWRQIGSRWDELDSSLWYRQMWRKLLELEMPQLQNPLSPTWRPSILTVLAAPKETRGTSQVLPNSFNKVK